VAYALYGNSIIFMSNIQAMLKLADSPVHRNQEPNETLLHLRRKAMFDDNMKGARLTRLMQESQAHSQLNPAVLRTEQQESQELRPVNTQRKSFYPKDRRVSLLRAVGFRSRDATFPHKIALSDEDASKGYAELAITLLSKAIDDV
jgi:hypothetical protein